jgi:hypothetical protein
MKSPVASHHASIHGVRLIACTLTDSVLKGTTNARLLKQLRRLSPGALLVMASDTLEESSSLQADSADTVPNRRQRMMVLGFTEVLLHL